MNNRKMRRKLFREFIEDGRKISSLCVAHKVVWLMEEKGLSQIESRKKLHIKANDYSRQIVRLYFARKERLIYQLENKLPEFGGLMVLELK